MVSSTKNTNKCGATCRRLVTIFEKLSVDEQRIIARLINNWEKRDQRRHPRFPCSIITECLAHSHVRKEMIKNISLGGAYIESVQCFPLNLEIKLNFFIPNFEIPIRSKSQIIWNGPYGFGVRFEKLGNGNIPFYGSL